MSKTSSRRATTALQQSTADASRKSVGEVPTRKSKAEAGRIMYIECKAGELNGEGRIGRVTFSKTGRTLYYRGKKLQSLKGAGFKSNY